MTNPNLPPQNPNVHNPSLAERAGVVALTALAGYGIHKGIQAAPVHETVGSPLTEVAEVAFMGGALAVSGLREVVTNGRIRLAEAGNHRAEKRIQKSERHARQSKKHHWQIMEGMPMPPPSSDEIDRDMVKPDLGDKLARVGQKIRHPFKKLGPNNHRATLTRREQRDIMRMNVRRDKRNLKWGEGDWMDDRFSKDTVVDPVTGEQTSDLGKKQGWRHFYEVPRNRADVKGYESAVHTKHHAQHAAHAIEQKTKEQIVERSRRAAKTDVAAKERYDGKIQKLEAKRERIRNREDRVSKIYDGAKAYPGKVAESFREGRDGTTTNDGRIQARINAAARKLGEWRGKKATPKAPTPPTP